MTRIEGYIQIFAKRNIVNGRKTRNYIRILPINDWSNFLQGVWTIVKNSSQWHSIKQTASSWRTNQINFISILLRTSKLHKFIVIVENFWWERQGGHIDYFFLRILVTDYRSEYAGNLLVLLLMRVFCGEKMPITNTVWTYVDFIFNFSRFFWKFVTFAKFLLVLAKPSQPLFSCFFNDFFSLQILRMNSKSPLNFNHLFNHLLDLFHFLKNELPPNHRLNLQNSPDLSLITIKPDSFLIVLFTNLFCIF